VENNRVSCFLSTNILFFYFLRGFAPFDSADAIPKMAASKSSEGG
jgi:hypothetical protein